MEILGGPLFSVAGAGESHGPGYTTIVFGCPPGLWIDRGAVQVYLDRRRPGGSRYGTPRAESDQLLLLSGLYDPDPDVLLGGPEVAIPVGEGLEAARTYEGGYTTGEPIAAVVLSTAKRSGDYAQVTGPAGAARPGHADLVKYHQSRGFADPRGGGRASYRATISDVIGGSIARLYLTHHFQTVILSSVLRVGPLAASRSLSTELEALVAQHTLARPVPPAALAEVAERLAQVEIPTLDPDFAERAAALIEQVRDEGDSLGSMVEVVAVNVPPLVGQPLYQSLKLRLMGALGGLNAAQSCEVGAGLEVVSRRGSENNDPIRHNGFLSNHHGGLLGGITTGMPLVCRVGFKPTSSIRKPQKSVRNDLTEIDFALEKGRHDPCAGVRAGITLESRMAIELMNAVLMHQAGHLDPDRFRLFTEGQGQ